MGGRRNPNASTAQMIIYKHPRQFMPPRLKTCFRFNKSDVQLNVATFYGNCRFTPTYAYDVDPVVGSTAIPGFTELGGIYRYYRVDAFKTTVSFANKDNVACVVYISPVNYDPGINTGTYQSYLSSRSTRKQFVGGLQGNNIGKLTMTTRLSDYAGTSTNIRMGDFYSARCDGSTIPSNNMWVMFGTRADANQISGVSYSIDIDIDIEFFELISPAT